MSRIDLNIEKTLLAREGKFDLQLELSLPSGSIAALYGPSGAGKTTVLRLVAGLASPDGGKIVVGGEVWYDGKEKIHLPPQKRKVGFVFQDYALFPHLTVRENLEFPLQKGDDRQLVEDLLEVTHLADLASRYPPTLSGGQQQRVALARALVRKPRLLLLDEPLSALDLDTRLVLQEEILALHREFGTTTLLVSHDLPEVFKLAEKVCVIKGGKIEKRGSPEEVFLRSTVSGKFRFTGEVIRLVFEDVICLVTVMVGNSAVKVVATRQEGKELKVGDRVMVFSKAFNPVIAKL